MKAYAVLSLASALLSGCAFLETASVHIQHQPQELKAPEKIAIRRVPPKPVESGNFSEGKIEPVDAMEDHSSDPSIQVISGLQFEESPEVEEPKATEVTVMEESKVSPKAEETKSPAVVEKMSAPTVEMPQKAKSVQRFADLPAIPGPPEPQPSPWPSKVWNSDEAQKFSMENRYFTEPVWLYKDGSYAQRNSQRIVGKWKIIENILSLEPHHGGRQIFSPKAGGGWQPESNGISTLRPSR